MEPNSMKSLSYEELRALYRSFLYSLNYKKTTINTSYSDSFYLWKKESKDLFWNVVSSTDFESVAKQALFKALSENSSGNINALVSGYMSHLRRFRLFSASDGVADLTAPKQEKTERPTHLRKKKLSVIVPDPSNDQVELYLEKWDGLENYRLQEDALNKLFFELCPNNKDITDILLKASTLNNFYSTNIFSIYPVA